MEPAARRRKGRPLFDKADQYRAIRGCKNGGHMVINLLRMWVGKEGRYQNGVT